MPNRKTAKDLLTGLKPTVRPDRANRSPEELERMRQAMTGGAGALPTPPAPPESLPLAAPQTAPAAAPQPVPPAVPPAVQQHNLLVPKHRDVLFSTSFRIPMSLKRELDDVADFNQIPRSEILVEALRLLLQSLPHPPEGWRQRK